MAVSKNFEETLRFKKRINVFGGLLIITILLGAALVLISLSHITASLFTMKWLGFGLVFMLTLLGVAARELLSQAGNIHQNEEDALFAARHDIVTGLVNRSYFRECLQIIAQSKDSDHTGMLAIFEIDNFKSINDTFGFAMGNALLKAATKIAAKGLRNTDVFARVGGDEFAIFRQGPSDAASLEAFNQEIRELYVDAVAFEGQRSMLSLCIGMFAVDQDFWNVDDALRKTEIALFHAKAEGKQRTRTFNDQMDIDTKRLYRLDNELRTALVNKQLSMVYQPLIDSKTGEISSVEALMRWHSPVLGSVSPGEFIPLAERNGQILELGKFAMRQACTDALKWPGIDISINVSAVQIKHSNFVDDVKAIVDEIGIDPKRVEIEITEGVMLDDNDQLRTVLLDLKDYGFRIALDDFGTGYSSLGYLQSFAFDTLKIDRSFVKNIGRSVDTNTIVYSVTAMGRSLGMVIVAEGVETEDQAAFLKAGLCDLFQGFLFSKPLAAADLTRRIMSREKLYMVG